MGEPVAFSEVFRAEVQCIARLKKSCGHSGSISEVPNVTNNLLGLSLSGGGIRAAIFQLGVLQALSSATFLHKFDYISAVSGGGYVAGWLAAWVARAQSFKTVSQALGASYTRPEPPAVSWFRNNSDYLTPRRSLLGADASDFTAAYLRNFVMNLAIWVMVMSFLLLLPRAALALYKDCSQNVALMQIAAILGGGLALFGLFYVLYGFVRHRASERKDATRRARIIDGVLSSLAATVVLIVFFAALEYYGYFTLWLPSLLVGAGLLLFQLPRPTAPGAQFRRVVVQSVLSAFFVSAWIFYWSLSSTGVVTPPYLHHFIVRGTDSFKVITYVSSVVVMFTFLWLVRQANLSKCARFLNSSVFGYLRCAFATLLTAVGCCYVVYRGAREASYLKYVVKSIGPERALPWFFTFRIPLYILLGTLAFSLLVAILGRAVPGVARDIVNRLSGMLYGAAAGWMLLGWIALYAPLYLERHYTQLYVLYLPLWLVCTLACFLVRQDMGFRPPYVRMAMFWFGRGVPYVFIAGLLMLCSWALNTYYFRVTVGREDGEYWSMMYGTFHVAVWATMAALALAGALLSWRCGVNLTSMHEFLIRRLERSFLTLEAENSSDASSPQKAVTMHSLSDPAVMGSDGCPYFLFNTALNLGKGVRAEWRDRAAASFLLSPLYCGYQYPWKMEAVERQGLAAVSFQRTSEYKYAEEHGVKLSTAMAISSSALGSNMGAYTSPRVRFLHTLFNLRLGVWFNNPRHKVSWSSRFPRSRLSMLWSELLGLTNERHPYVYLSDGGHFENLGIYELVRRRCRLIVCCDASEDPSSEYSALGNAVQRCRTDFGVEIVFGPERLFSVQNGTRRSFAVAYGKICYSLAGEEADGVLVYLKPTIGGEESADIINYKIRQEDFPHHSTMIQWFGESRFEGYRSLGFFIGKSFADDICGQNGVPGNEADLLSMVRAMLGMAGERAEAAYGSN
jgi:hypothetical protein